MEPAAREQLILDLVREQLTYVYENLPFYHELYDRHSFHPSEVQTLDDFTRKVPIVTKDLLRQEQEQHPVFGRYLGFDLEDGIHIHGSSGTMGRPTFYLFSSADLEYIREVMAQAFYIAGVRLNDIVQISTDLGMFMGGWGTLWGVERIGAKAFTPGAGNAERHVRLMYQVGSTVLVTTPTFALRLLDTARSLGYDTTQSPLRLGTFIGEPGAGIPGIKRALEEGWGIAALDCASTSEMTPWATNVECPHKQGMHVINDEVYTEIVAKDDPSRRLSEGESGAVIYTHLRRKGQPMIRFWSGDESRMVSDPCPCGRTYPRLPDGVYGRVDDMLLIRGVNVYPSTIQRALLEIADLGSEHRIVLERKTYMDEVTIVIEYAPHYLQTKSEAEHATYLEHLRTHVRHHIAAVTGYA
ncbi:MAG: phenylacetate--CoA ligase family protein [Ktedonobacteraceae bacterium]|nr:phenylacetate--CoA ligase family protein [Ktedonobacteraceae bacterium]